MSVQKTRKFCSECDKNCLAERPGTSHLLHLLMTLLTGGLWSIIWVGTIVKFGGWKCPTCGKKL